MSWKTYLETEQRRRESGFDYHSQMTYLVGRLHRILRTAVTEAIAPHGLGFAEFALLNIVRAAEPVTNADLARLTSVSPQGTSRLVGKLMALGALDRLDGPGGLQPIVLTGAGRELHDTLLGVEESVVAQLGSGDDTLPGELREIISRALARLDDSEIA